MPTPERDSPHPMICILAPANLSFFLAPKGRQGDLLIDDGSRLAGVETRSTATCHAKIQRPLA